MTIEEVHDEPTAPSGGMKIEEVHDDDVPDLEKVDEEEL